MIVRHGGGFDPDDEHDAELLALLAEFEDANEGLASFVERGARFAREMGVPGAAQVEAAAKEVNQGEQRRRRRRQAQRQKLNDAEQREAVRDAVDEAEARFERSRRNDRARVRQHENALKNRLNQIAELVRERDLIRQRLAQLEAENTELEKKSDEWPTEAKVVTGLAGAAVLLAIAKALSDRGKS